MSRLISKFWVLVGIFAIINISGILWIHHDLTRVAPRTILIKSATPLVNAENAKRFSLVFDRPLAHTNGNNILSADTLFKLEPDWPGQWVWADDNTLDYRFDKPLPSGRIFNVRPIINFKKTTGWVLAGDNEFEIKTSPLCLENCQLDSVDEEQVTLELTFSQLVGPADLVQSIRFTDDKTREHLDQVLCLTKTQDTRLVIQVQRPDSDTLKMELMAGLTGYQAQIPLEETICRTFTLEQGFSLLNSYASTPRLDQGVTVTLRFSHSLNSEQAIPHLQIEPRVENVALRRSSRYLRIDGKFIPGETYTITVPATLSDTNNRTLGKEQRTTVRIGDYHPELAFSWSQGILSPYGNLQTELQAVNIDQIEISAWKLLENNLVTHLHHNSSWYCDETSQLILNQTLSPRMPNNQPQKILLELDRLLGKPLGVYRISADLNNAPWNSCETVVTITDLAITAKTERDGMLVWVTSLRHGQPVADVTVSGLSYNNQLLAAAQTDVNGLARLQYVSNHPDGVPWVITARKDNDLAFLQPGDNQWLFDDVNQSGQEYPRNYEVMLYSERGVYRPGETIFLSGILRDRKGEIPTPFPLNLKVTRPDGRQLADIPVQPHSSGQGIYHVAYQTAISHQTGTYQFDVTLPSSEESLGTVSAQLEAFVPVRMEVNASTVKEIFGPDDCPEMDISARYLWDQPAAGLSLTLTGRLRQVNFHSNKYPDRQFGMPLSSQDILLPEITEQLAQDGKAHLKAPLPEQIMPGRYQTNLTATVSEPGGRSVSANIQCVLDRLNTHLGLRLPDGRLAQPQTPFTLDWIALNALEDSISVKSLDMEFSRIEYNTVLKEVNDRYVWRSEEILHTIESRQILCNASTGRLELTCPSIGRYRLDLRDPDSRSISRIEFYARSSDSSSVVRSMNQPERLDLITDRAQYAPGDEMDILIQSPVSGTMLMTLETDQIIVSKLETVPQNTARAKLKIPADLRGSAYLTASIVRPVDPGAKSLMPHRAMGMTRIQLNHERRMIPIKIQAPLKVKPQSDIKVSLETAPPLDPNRPACIHFWAVDEGILLTSGYQTPDPFKFFMAPRQPGVATSDSFFRLLPDYTRPEGMMRIGADNDPDSFYDPLRRNPVASKTRQSAVVFTQALPVQPDGITSVNFKVPDYIGQLRLMAIAVDHDHYGSCRQDMTLTQPLIMETSWPRFAAPGDEFEVPVKLFNDTDRALELNVKTIVDGPLEIDPNRFAESIAVSTDTPATLWLKARATALGPVTVNIEACETGPDGRGISATNQSHFPIRAGLPLHTEVLIESIKAGDTFALAPSDTFITETVRAHVALSARPDIQMTAALESLIDYPYGCAEQTASRLLALLYAPSILDIGRAEAIGNMITAGINRLWSMQTLSGGLSYWPGYAHANQWATAYGAFCLAEARLAGHQIDSRFVDELIQYLENQLANCQTDQNPDWNTLALYCRVLAIFEKPPHGWMNRLAERSDQLDIGGRANLAGAFIAVGRNDRALSLLPVDLPSAGAIPNVTSGRITSPARQLALWLSVLLELDADHPNVPILARHLYQTRQNGCWGNTLENATVVLALSRYQIFTTDTPPEFNGSLQFPDKNSVPFDQSGLDYKIQPGNLPATLTSQGNGTLFACISYEGLALPETIKPYNRQLTVTRHWLNRQGATIEPQKIRVGDLIQVEISLRSDLETIDNIAVIDALPAGLEIENPRLITSAESDSPTSDTPDHIEFLDDRAIIFCSASRTLQTFRYSLRAVTVGQFVLPAIQASCMYNPSVASLGTAGTMTIHQ